MTSTDAPCPLCKSSASAIDIDHGAVTKFKCRCCGEFEATDPEIVLNKIPKPLHLISHFLRQRYEQTGQTYAMGDREGGSFPERLREFSVQDKLARALVCVADKTVGFGRTSSCKTETDWPIAQARDQHEFSRMLEHWRSEDALAVDNSNRKASQDGMGYVVTGKGWRLIEEFRPSRGTSGRQAFVAMSFADEMKPAFARGIEPALVEMDWTPYRVDRHEFEEKICDRIVMEIKRSDLMVVECTGSRPNVYFEAGLASGLNIPVIWCVRQDELDEKGVAFDTRQYAHLAWSAPEELRMKLVSRIGALYSSRA